MSITSIMSLLAVFSEGIATLNKTYPKHILEKEKRRIIDKLELLIEQVKEL
jgi:hypothetical protein